MWTSYRVGRLFGVPVGLNPSWFIAFALVTGMLALRVYPGAVPARGADLYWSMALVSGVLFFLSILLHELAHSVVAKAFGIPVRGITLFLLGGVSQITRDAPRARQEFLMAFAGPVTSLGLAAIALGAWVAAGAGQGPVAAVLEWLWLMNFAMGVFNLVPGFPLDGGRVLRAALWGVSGSYAGATRWAAYIGRAIAWLIVAFGAASILLGEFGAGIIGGLWLVAIGVFLDLGARGSWLRVRSLMALRERSVGELAESDWPMVAPYALISDIDAEGMVADDDNLVVVEDRRVVGILLGGSALRALAVSGSSTAASAMIPAERLDPVGAGETALVAWERMEADDLDLLPVIDGDRFAGIVRRRAILDFMSRSTG